jgi:acetoacetate decarboxylase
MKIADVRARAFAMPLNDPSYPPEPYRFNAREYFVIEHLTDPDALRAVVAEPLEVSDPIVKFKFIRLPDTTGFGDLTECGQMIPVRFQGERRIFVHSMYLDDEAPIAGGREIWGFPQKLVRPKLCHESEVLVGTLHFGPVLCAVGTRKYLRQNRRRRLASYPSTRRCDSLTWLAFSMKRQSPASSRDVSRRSLIRSRNEKRAHEIT